MTELLGWQGVKNSTNRGLIGCFGAQNESVKSVGVPYQKNMGGCYD